MTISIDLSNPVARTIELAVVSASYQFDKATPSPFLASPALAEAPLLPNRYKRLLHLPEHWSSGLTQSILSHTNGMTSIKSCESVAL
jgi:hypothetical protein